MPQKRKQHLAFQSELFVVFGLLLAVWGGGAVFYHVVEGLSYVDAIYFTACTLTTVGYGDITPKTDAGKLFTAVYAFVGIGFFLGFAAALFQSISGRLRRNN
ncbi:MAG TPA: potassium channel family protein [Candidatus Saccharimonadales bacterium]|nr:potassium channel family protein [Candidatus Saccharimonadales bacterium]